MHPHPTLAAPITIGPGVIGPTIGAAVLKNAELVVGSDGTVSFLPNADIWLAAFAAGLVLCVLLAVLFARLKKEPQPLPRQ